ncbi:MAG: hypothetical protein QOD75_819 [Blastocatellia bacterium]|jgi:hypothetical protein|nr:hypothetical protein [Blastocatellia bacterium]
MLLKLEREQVVITMQRNDFRHMLMHCLDQTGDRYDSDHLRRLSQMLWDYFDAAEEIEQRALSQLGNGT